jgi:hypothetical protein
VEDSFGAHAGLKDMAEKVGEFAIAGLGEKKHTVIADGVGKILKVAEALAVLFLHLVAEGLLAGLQRMEFIREGGLCVIEGTIGDDGLGVLHLRRFLVERDELLFAFAGDPGGRGLGDLHASFEDDIAEEGDFGFERLAAGGFGLFVPAGDGGLEGIAGDLALFANLFLALGDLRLKVGVGAFEFGFELFTAGPDFRRPALR